MNSSISILFLGDIVGKPGRRVVTKFLAARKPAADLVIANVENCAHGFGLTEQNLKELKESGVQVFTGGNHTFDRKEIFDFIGDYPNVLRPANYPQGTPGKGFHIVEVGDVKVAVINILGRVFMEPLQSPFLVADELVNEAAQHTKLIFVDFHAEATAEKVTMGLYLDGRVSAVIGTHTHIQTADEKILPGGTGYLTDAGCCAPAYSVIGMDKEAVFRRMVKQLPSRFEVAAGPASACGVTLTIDKETGKTTSITRVFFLEDDVAENEK